MPDKRERTVVATASQVAIAMVTVLIALLVPALIVADFLRIDVHSHSASDTLINWVPQTAVIVLAALALMRTIRRLGR
jgi:hypothetical protein